MLSFLPAAMFASRKPRCRGSGSAVLRARRAATDEKYTARPGDLFPSVLVSREQLQLARAEAGMLDVLFGRYKREAECEGEGDGERTTPARRLRRCEGCGEWCCNVSWSLFRLFRFVFAFSLPFPVSVGFEFHVSGFFYTKNCFSF